MSFTLTHATRTCLSEYLSSKSQNDSKFHLFLTWRTHHWNMELICIEYTTVRPTVAALSASRAPTAANVVAITKSEPSMSRRKPSQRETQMNIEYAFPWSFYVRVWEGG